MMDDDIDIEEHDVLDNPRIRSMFPDLSRVKIEVIDDDEDNNEVEQFNNLDDQQPLLYQNFNVSSGNGSDFMNYHDFSDNHDTDFVSDNQHVDSDNGVIGHSDHIGIDSGHIGVDSGRTGVDSGYTGVDSGHIGVDSGHIGVDSDYINEANEVRRDVASDHSYAAAFDDGFDTNHLNSDSNVLNAYSCDDNVVDTDNMFMVNKIILGSKPVSKPNNSYEIILGTKVNGEHNIADHQEANTFDYNTLYNEALSSNSVVALEDWGVRLNSNLCFCKECKILFPTVNALDAHKMVSHSFLVALDVQYNTARKSTSAQNSGKFCSHCNQIFPDDTSLIKHLYRLLPASKFQDTEVEKKKANVKLEVEPTPAVTSILKCTLCNKLFKNKYAAKKHKETSHPNVKRSRRIFEVIKNNKQFVDIVEDSAKTSKGAIKLDRNNDPAERSKGSINVDKNIDSAERSKGSINLDRNKDIFSQLLVSKSTLFKCPNCKIHFMMASTALQHYRSCDFRCKGLSAKCRTCKRKIGTRDYYSHLMQHTFNEKIKCYSVYDRIYEKILYKCPKCSICFSEFTFSAHYRSCQSIQPQLEFLLNKCAICDLHIESAKFQIHQQRHKRFSKEDFIVLYFSERPQVVKQKPLKKVPKLDFKCDDDDGNSDKIKLFYCKYCSCCKTKSWTTSHGENHCSVMNGGTRKQCQHCGLIFTVKSIVLHSAWHARRTVTLRDFVFYDLFTGESIYPPINDLHKCQSCDIIFLSKATLRYHICKKEKYEVCYICHKKYNLAAYAVHQQFHSYLNEESLMPELIKKYNLINETWNIIYKCSTCRIVSMSYDFAVEHSQRHINDVADDKSVHCAACALDIEECNYKSHMELHASNPTASKPFKIFTYDYRTLFKDEWMRLFQSLPKQDVDIILSKSIYKDVRSVKLNRVSKSNSDIVQFYCNRCKVSVDDVGRHLKENCVASPKYSCSHCKMRIKTLSKLLIHNTNHGDNNDKFAVVTFNDEKDVAFDETLREYATTNENEEVEDNMDMGDDEFSESDEITNKKPTGNNNKYRLFRCSKCLVVETRINIMYHACSPSTRKLCRKCKEYYSAKAYARHERLHQTEPKLSWNTINVTDFNNEKNGQYFMLLYRCRSCKCCINCPGWTKHHVCSSYHNNVHCNICDLHFLYKTYLSHKAAHEKHSNLNKKTIRVVDFDPLNEEPALDETTNHTNDGEEEEQVLSDAVGESEEERAPSGAVESVYRMYKCRFCNVTSSEMGILQHQCSVRKRYCVKCKLFFTAAFYKRHLKAHKENPNLSKSISTTYYNSDHKMKDHFTVYKCINCSHSFKLRSWLKTHKCKLQGAEKYCDQCDLYLSKRSYRAHRAAHAIVPNLSHRIKIINVDPSGKTVSNEQTKQKHKTNISENKSNEEESVDDNKHKKKRSEHFKLASLKVNSKKSRSRKYTFYVCVKCEVSFVCKGTIRTHHCSKAYLKKYCKKCDMYVAQRRFHKHIDLHRKYRMLSKKTVNLVRLNSNGQPLDSTHQDVGDNVVDNETTSMSSDDETLSSVNNKTKKDTQDNNQVTEEVSQESGSRRFTFFLCTKCNVSFMSKVSIRRHECRIAYPKRHCKKCDVNVARHRAFYIHTALHDKYPTLSKKTIRIVRFNNAGEQVEQVEHSSAIGTDDGDEIDTLKAHDRTLAVLYQCRKCKVCVMHRKSARYHICRRELETVFCDKCRVRVTRQWGYSRHVRMHDEIPELNKDNLKILYFSTDGTRVVWADTGDSTTRLRVKCPRFYKCAKCGVCAMRKWTIDTSHRCAPLSRAVYCSKCKQYFTTKSFVSHKETHRLHPNLAEGTVPVILVNRPANNKVKQPTNRVVVYSCACDLHFTSLASIRKHLDVCGTTDVSKEKCSKCFLFFPTDILVTHLVNHHSVNKTSVLVKRVYKASFYECPKCPTRYRKQDLLKVHIKSSCKRKECSKCRHCGIFYENSYFDEHRCIDSETNVYINETIEMPSKKDFNEQSAFRCVECDVHFSNLRSYHAHVKLNHKIVHRMRSCDICGLRFSADSYRKHGEVHRGSSDYKIKVFIPKTETFTIKTGRNPDDVCDKNSVSSDEEIHTGKKRNADSDVTTLTAKRPRRSAHVIDKDQANTPLANSIAKKIIFEEDLAGETDLGGEATKKAASMYDNKLYRCPVCSLHYNHYEALKTHLKRTTNDHHDIPFKTCNICGLDFSKGSLKTHKHVHHGVMNLKHVEDFVVNTVDDAFAIIHDVTNDATDDVTNDVTDDTADSSTNENKDTVRLFKCKECKVYFTTLKKCANHLTNHEVVDSKFCIECKICGCQFMIKHLKEHMEKNHVGDNSDDLLIEEYTSVNGGLVKVGVYNAVDRVQSEMVSTTTGFDDEENSKVGDE